MYDFLEVKEINYVEQTKALDFTMNILVCAQHDIVVQQLIYTQIHVEYMHTDSQFPCRKDTVTLWYTVCTFVDILKKISFIPIIHIMRIHNHTHMHPIRMHLQPFFPPHIHPQKHSTCTHIMHHCITVSQPIPGISNLIHSFSPSSFLPSHSQIASAMHINNTQIKIRLIKITPGPATRTLVPVRKQHNDGSFSGAGGRKREHP